MLFKSKNIKFYLYLNLTGEKQMELVELHNLRLIITCSYQAILFTKR